jgi:hypothetical protein
VPSKNVFEEVARYANPSRRTFLLGLLGAAITAPTVVSFFGKSGQAIGPQSLTPNGGLTIWNGNWFDTRYFYDPSANWLTDPSANYLCDISANYPYYSANPIRDLSGNYYIDLSGNYNYFEDIYYDASGNSYVVHEVTGNAYYEPSGNWVCDPQGQFLYDPSGNWTRMTPEPVPDTATTVPTTQAPATSTTSPTSTTVAPVAATQSSPSATTPQKLPETR